MDFNDMVQTQLSGQIIQVSISHCEEDTVEAERLIATLNLLKEKIIVWCNFSITAGKCLSPC
jgi:hypothetical protein